VPSTLASSGEKKVKAIQLDALAVDFDMGAGADMCQPAHVGELMPCAWGNIEVDIVLRSEAYFRGQKWQHQSQKGKLQRTEKERQ